MTTDERITASLELVRLARQHITDGETSPDPVWERRHLARAAARLRLAAAVLDDQGRLDPDWESGGR